ncbi:hypothetical protein CP533_0556 [Ophiocordyceps camponoti-saundersi (nom. inval.)]|nr:hypothetical protein CP533_0556 [Ophiocordyceps camponoti-saundersi (nom. inval.)]
MYRLDRASASVRSAPSVGLSVAASDRRSSSFRCTCLRVGFHTAAGHRTALHRIALHRAASRQ